ncbi:hypothetical protein GCM10010515_71040 [Streptomyces fructofermentans]|uniref:Uncharacterized protein n=1 Tax=Streptomyces fructofermentans TaxID=152141 RepID=A0A918NTT9_9ACTN|nr:hypothetical protein GCM10010515_71040 [Streptomyces fructofermentans]
MGCVSNTDSACTTWIGSNLRGGGGRWPAIRPAAGAAGQACTHHRQPAERLRIACNDPLPPGHHRRRLLNGQPERVGLVRVSAIEPGIAGTELQSHVTDAGANAWLEASKETTAWLQPEDIAQTVGFIASLPLRVNLPQVFIMPTAQPSCPLPARPPCRAPDAGRRYAAAAGQATSNGALCRSACWWRAEGETPPIRLGGGG